MANVQAFYAEVTKRRGELQAQFPEGFLYVTSVDNFEKLSKPGVVQQVTVDNAAQLIVSGTHKVSTDDEIQGFMEHQRAEAQKYANAELAKIEREVRIKVEAAQGSRVTQEPVAVPFPIGGDKGKGK